MDENDLSKETEEMATKQIRVTNREVFDFHFTLSPERRNAIYALGGAKADLVMMKEMMGFLKLEGTPTGYEAHNGLGEYTIFFDTNE